MRKHRKVLIAAVLTLTGSALLLLFLLGNPKAFMGLSEGNRQSAPPASGSNPPASSLGDLVFTPVHAQSSPNLIYLPLIMKGYNPCAGVAAPVIEVPEEGDVYHSNPDNGGTSIWSSVADPWASSIQGSISSAWLPYSPQGDPGNHWARYFSIPAKPDGTRQNITLKVTNGCLASQVRFTVRWETPPTPPERCYDEYGRQIECSGGQDD